MKTETKVVTGSRNAAGYVVVDKFGEGITVAGYAREDYAREAASNINRLTGHETAVYVGDHRLVTFFGRSE